MKRNIAIIAGGDSSEHEVSLRSAAGLFSFMDKERYHIDVVVMKGIHWAVIPHELMATAQVIDAELLKQAYLINKDDFSYSDQEGIRHTFDFAYITIHGTPGENGLLQGYLDMMAIPYSCCDVLAAALTFNKYACNHYLSGFGIKISPSLLIRGVKGQKTNFKTINGVAITSDDIVKEIGLPCFIKSNVGGSSFGCTKVKKVEEVLPAIVRAFEEGDEVICEAFMKGTEITCGVFKTRAKEVAFPITEVVTHNEFFDYNAKYKGEVDEITPARIPDTVRDRVQALTLRIYDIIGAGGIIRVDYILTEGWDIHLLEVNTTPGMTPTSFIPQQIRAAEMEIQNVLTDIIENKF